MPRRSWIYTSDGRTIEKGSDEHRAYEMAKYGEAPLVFGDSEEFVSPIDGLAYSGKVAAREHNKRHDVVNWRDLKGLPQSMPAQLPDRREIRQTIIETARRRGYLEGQ